MRDDREWSLIVKSLALSAGKAGSAADDGVAFEFLWVIVAVGGGREPRRDMRRTVRKMGFEAEGSLPRMSIKRSGVVCAPQQQRRKPRRCCEPLPA